MNELREYLNNFKTILEIGKLDKVLFENNSFIDKKIFLEEVECFAKSNFNKNKNPTLSEDQFKESIYNAKLKTINTVINQLVEKKVLSKMINDKGEITYKINDSNSAPDWLKDIL